MSGNDELEPFASRMRKPFLHLSLELELPWFARPWLFAKNPTLSLIAATRIRLRTAGTPRYNGSCLFRPHPNFTEHGVNQSDQPHFPQGDLVAAVIRV